MKRLNVKCRMLIIVLLLGCTTASYAEIREKNEESFIRVNQVGYQPNGPKIIVVSSDIDKVVVEDQFHNRVYSSVSTVCALSWPYSGESVRIVDLTEFSKPGKYRIVDAKRHVQSSEFTVADTVYQSLSYASLKAFYLNRCSLPVESQYAGRWARKEGHPDNRILIHSSAASSERPENSVISSPKGWYDAGDYNKYIVNSGITTYTLLLAYQLHPEYYKKMNLNIPESGNGVPDILNEALWNIRWMLTMQDPNDGGVYHKLTNKVFDGFVMPEEATAPRYVVQKTTAAALDFAAAMSASYRIFKDYEKQMPGFADSCLTAGQQAWKWAKQNPSVLYVQPSDIQTGAYDDNFLDDEWYWSAIEMAISTGDRSYLQGINLEREAYRIQTWNNVEMLGLFSLLLNGQEVVNSEQLAKLKSSYLTVSDSLCEKEQKSAYRVSLDFFAWGSNSDVVNEGIIKMVAFKLTNDSKYRQSAYTDLDYILGKNAVGYCFVTGFGTKSPMNIHHRPSASDGIEDPIPGFLAGGPNLVVLTDCPNSGRNSVYPAKSYVDALCSYSTNEIAINWNAPLVCLVGLLDEQN